MHRKIILSIIGLLSTIYLFGQNKVVIFFETDEYIVNDAEKRKLDSLVTDIVNINKVELVGHTDNIGDTTYNMVLSKNRVKEVRNYLLQKGLPKDKVQIAFYGESRPVNTNTSDKGRQMNRRVDVLIYKAKITRIDSPTSINKELELVDDDKNSQQNTDTTTRIINRPLLDEDTILLIDEVAIEITKSDYYKYKDCLEIKPITNGEDALANGLTTITSENELLISCGMIKVSLRDSCEGCFDKPIKVRFPIPDNECRLCNFRDVYNVSGNGRWRLANDQKIKVVKRKGRNYYEMMVKCPNTTNCDCKPKEKKVKFTIPRNLQLLSFNVTYNCPIINWDFEVDKNRAKGKLACAVTGREGFVHLKAINQEQDTLVINGKPLRELQHSVIKRCKKNRKVNKLLVFKTYGQKIYSKYKIKEEDLE